MNNSHLLILLALGFSQLFAQPLVDSWLTNPSGRYARIYETAADEASQNAVTTWIRGAGDQNMPTYSGVHEVASTATDVYIRTSGLGFHVMGPWYLNEQRTNLFPNYPANRSVLYRFAREPGPVPAGKTSTGLGVIGYFVDGVAMFDSRDAFSYSSTNNVDASPQNGLSGDDVWNRDAYVNESVTFDAGNAHQAGPTYHYHANPPGLRHQIGDSVTYNETSNTYTEAFSGHHSPILGWVRDGYPIYGPYGYADADTNSTDQTVVRMRSGFQKRDGSNGSANLITSGRTTLPLWAFTYDNRAINVPPQFTGPPVNGAYTLGHYVEDYAYLGDLGFTLGVDFDLDVHNGRFCRTPEFPNGTYAYFVSIEADGTPKFPYNIGPFYYGTPSGNNANTVPETAVIHFEGGPERDASTVDMSPDDDVILLWSGIEGGTYQVERSADLQQWIVLSEEETVSLSELGILADTNRGVNSSFQAYRTRLTSVAPFDQSGFDYTPAVDPLTPLTLTLSPGAPADLSILPESLRINGQPVIIVSRPSQDEIVFLVDLSILPEGTHTLEATFAGIPGPQTATYNVVNKPNILLLILDDWGIDASPLDNPGGLTAHMPTLETLAASGVRFTRAHSQPVCSPTRATILTGRQVFRHGIGNPVDGNEAILSSELTIPELFTQEGAPHATANFGKWHLGGGNSGPADLGGWDKFAGIIQGGVASYTNWNKVEDGVRTNNVPTYSTSDQVNEAVEFITNQGTNSWFVWIGFNAPHDPFEDPPAALAPAGGYSNLEVGESTNSLYYRRSLEAWDTELARLLASVDLDTTDIILIGDNGTPGQVVQAPYGDGHAKGSLNRGGVHVPMLVSGPSVKIATNTTVDTLVHCVDLFPTILEIAGVDPATALQGVEIDGISILPILDGTDTADRCVVVEKQDPGASGSGRGIQLDDYPDYRMIINGDPNDDTDIPTFEFYNIALDENEQTNLLASANQAAYDALLAKDAALGGGYSDYPTGPQDILYLRLLDPAGMPNIPPLLNGNGNPVNPSSILVDGVAPTFIGRINSGSDLNTESDDLADSMWVKCLMAPPAAGYTNAVVEFNRQGNITTWNADLIQILP